MQLTDEQNLIIETAHVSSERELKPMAATWDKKGHLDRPALVALGELGFGGIYCKEEFGGSGLSRLDAVLIFEQLSRGDISHAAFLSIHNMATWMIDTFGDDQLRQKYCPKLTSTELIASYCLTEPGAGSDAASLKTKATCDGDAYVLNGSKMFISGASFSDIYVVMASASDDGAKGVSAFVVENGTPGLSFGKPEKKMGWRAQPTATVSFDDCRIPASNRIGPEGDGFKYAMAGLDGGRLNIAACALGGAQDAYDRAFAYSQERQQFGKPISDFQATKFCAMAKCFVTDSASKIANDALQLHGGYGYLADYEVERIVRDLRVHQILEGTNEVMRVIVARELERGK